jgi:2-oxoglutarate ferredoxin oxidoreductase subunit gamma
MLGAVIGLTQIVKTDSIVKVLESKIPSGFLEMNKKALDLGLQLAEASSSKQG